MAQKQQTVEIRQFVISNVREHPRGIAKLLCEAFLISRQAASKHLREMEASGTLRSEGRTRGKRWELCPRAEFTFELEVDSALEEHVPWMETVKPQLQGVSPNVLQIASYSFTEMLNNVIDHSKTDHARIACLYTADSVRLTITDFGVGIFRKIKDECGLSDEREAILELAKGKLTTDPSRHTGEGIFFTSRACDIFSVWSGNLFFTHVRPDEDWLVETEKEFRDGTCVDMVVSLQSSLTLESLFEKYASSQEDMSFSRTHVPIRLASFDSDSLVSRSQARRVLARFERFKEVCLDFSGVDFIGQAFADEIFRVFQNEHPEVAILVVNANAYIQGMIQRARSNRPPADPRQMRLFDTDS